MYIVNHVYLTCNIPKSYFLFFPPNPFPFLLLSSLPPPRLSSFDGLNCFLRNPFSKLSFSLMKVRNGSRYKKYKNSIM